MKKTIEIECPDGYKPIYNAETGNVEIVPENIMGRIRTYEDAVNYLGCVTRDTIYYNRSVNSLAKLQTVLDALNEGHKFNLLTGTIWYPWVRFFRMKSVPKDAEVIGHFRYQGEKFALVGCCARYGGSAGLGFSFLPMASAMPVPMSGCQRANLKKLPNTYQPSLESQCSMLVLQDISRVKNLNGLTNEKVPCNYACYALDERSSFFSDNYITRRL